MIEQTYCGFFWYIIFHSFLGLAWLLTWTWIQTLPLSWHWHYNELRVRSRKSLWCPTSILFHPLGDFWLRTSAQWHSRCAWSRSSSTTKTCWSYSRCLYKCTSRSRYLIGLIYLYLLGWIFLWWVCFPHSVPSHIWNDRPGVISWMKCL